MEASKIFQCTSLKNRSVAKPGLKEVLHPIQNTTQTLSTFQKEFTEQQSTDPLSNIINSTKKIFTKNLDS